MHDPADDAAIVNPLDATNIGRQMQLDPGPLFVVQPKQIPAHDPDPFPKTNQDRIVSRQKLMSSDPSDRMLKDVVRARYSLQNPALLFEAALDITAVGQHVP
jgi:hypothetical protein